MARNVLIAEAYRLLAAVARAAVAEAKTKDSTHSSVCGFPCNGIVNGMPLMPNDRVIFELDSYNVYAWTPATWAFISGPIAIGGPVSSSGVCPAAQSKEYIAALDVLPICTQLFPEATYGFRVHFPHYTTPGVYEWRPWSLVGNSNAGLAAALMQHADSLPSSTNEVAEGNTPNLLPTIDEWSRSESSVLYAVATSILASTINTLGGAVAAGPSPAAARAMLVSNLRDAGKLETIQKELVNPTPFP